MLTMDTSIQYVKGVGEKRAALFSRLGISTIRDLLKHFPREYADWANTLSIDEAPFDEPCCIKAMAISTPQEHRVRKGMVLYKFMVTDGTTDMHITLFNNRFAAQKVKRGETYLFFGKVSGSFHRREMTSPQIEAVEGSERLRPIYPQTAGLNSRAIEKVIRAAIDGLGSSLQEDFLPEIIRNRYDLIDRGRALYQIHFPDNMQQVDEARKRLVFEEYLILQLGLAELKGKSHSQTRTIIKEDKTKEFCEYLPFTLTGAQSRAIADCIKDMQSGTSMSRLLQGDVGSGKTAVAAAITYSLVKSGWQAAMMAPTEILATQHAETLSKMLEPAGINVGLLTAGMKASAKKETLKQLADGSMDLVIGTQALLSDTTVFHNLGLVITDEQHRFGVHQRATLAAKGDNPHMLVMSATPIPRTLALIVFGDLDVSILDELPPGRKPIRTYAVGTEMRERIYAYIRKHIDVGQQVYIVCPLVGDGESIEELPDDRVAATEYADTLRNGPFKGYTLGLLHGKMKAAEKEAVMKDFSEGRTSILVSTTVIEVGVDVPNATLMIIENADLFGLAQLHQLRGRVGRGEYQSDCILISDSRGEEAHRRLKAMCATNDGFKIADEDLKMRGPGDFFGSRQHGLPTLKSIPMSSDMVLMTQSQTAALDMIRTDALSRPEYSALKNQVQILFESVGEKGFT